MNAVLGCNLKNDRIISVHYEGKVPCCKEQYCIETCNVKSMNQGKLELVEQEMARVNTAIIGIGKLKWIEMGEIYPDDHYIYYCE